VSGFPPDHGPDQGPGGFGFNPSDLGAMFGQLSRMFSGSGDPLDPANLSTQARQQLAQFGPDPSVAEAEKNAVRAAVDLADLWVDAATDMRAATRHAQAWSRAEWVEATVPAWRDLLGPVISGMHDQSLTDLGNASAGLAAGGESGVPGIDLGALQQMIGPMLGAMLGGQVATGIAKLASEVLGAADVGLPLAPTGVSALVPANIKAFAEGLERPFDEVRLYLALRESAHARLFASTPWLTSTISSVLTSAAAGSTPKLGNLSELMGSIDPNNPEEAMQTIAARMEESTDTPEQHKRENQLETVLALVIGWVDDVVTGAAAGRLPAEPALQEALRRRRASGGPAEQVFAEIAGLELRPRRVRDAAALWAKLREAGGEATRDRVWSHPDFLPSSADLDDPASFVSAFMAPESDFSALDELTRPRTDEERIDDERRDRDDDGHDGPAGPIEPDNGPAGPTPA
jgi:putative hydrolase